MMGELDFSYQPPTPEEVARNFRQQSLYTAQAFFSGKSPSEDEFFAFCQRVVAYVTGE